MLRGQHGMGGCAHQAQKHISISVLGFRDGCRQDPGRRPEHRAGERSLDVHSCSCCTRKSCYRTGQCERCAPGDIVVRLGRTTGRIACADIQDRLRHIERRCRKFDQFPLAVEHAELARENRPCRRNRCLIIDSVIVIRSRILAPADPPSGIQAVSADQCVFPVRHQGNISSRNL